MQNGFPNKEAMPAVTAAINDLMSGIQHYVNSISQYTKQGDLQILCYLVSSLFINGCREYIEAVRQERNDAPEQGLRAYEGCIANLREMVCSEEVIKFFEHPPEGWLNKAIRV